MKKNIIRLFLVPLAAYFFCFSVYGIRYIFNPNNTYQLPGYDQDGSSFLKKITADNDRAGSYSRFTNKLYYPYGWSIANLPLGSIIDHLVVYSVNYFPGTTIFFWHNIGTILVSLSSALFAFYLCYYLTNNYLGSLLGGYIYAYSGLNLIYTGGNDPLQYIQFIPLALLVFFYYLDHKSPKNFIYLMSVLALNNITSIYWGWFLYLTLTIIAFTDFFIYKKYFTKIVGIFWFLGIVSIASGLLTILLNLNFFYYSGKYLRPSESSKINRSASKTSFTLAESPDRYLIPSVYSLWPEHDNRFEANKSYIPITLVITFLLILLGYKNLSDRKKWIFVIGTSAVIFYILISSTNLQLIFRTIMPPIVAYSRTQILLTLFLGISASIAFSEILNKKILGLIFLLIAFDTFIPNGLYLTNLKTDLPRVVSELTGTYKGEGSLLFFPWRCGRYGFGNLLYSVIHEWPIANPYFAPTDEKSSFLCNQINDHTNPNLTTYISLFDVRKIVVYPDEGLPIDIQQFEKNLGKCLENKKMMKDNVFTKDAFDQHRNAVIYDVSQLCREKTLISDEVFKVEKSINLVEVGSESAFLKKFTEESNPSSFVFKKFASISQENIDKLKNVDYVELEANKISSYQIDLSIPPTRNGIVVTFNFPVMEHDGWKIYDNRGNLGEYSVFRKYKALSGFVFESNLNNTSVYFAPHNESRSVKLVYKPYYLDKLFKNTSDTASILGIVIIIVILSSDFLNRKKHDS